VVTCLPAGVSIGTAATAGAVSQMRSTFPDIRFSLTVGIGGGAPSGKNDIRLGDVVVSKPTAAGTSGGVMQYDTGATSGGRFEQIGALNQPPPILLAVVLQLESTSMIKMDHSISDILSDLFEKNPDMNI
jgi:nucleoside phosphorylase